MASFGQGINPQLGAINYQPYLQGAAQGSAAVGQGIGQLLQGAGQAVQQYYAKQEEKKQFEGFTSYAKKVQEENPEMWKQAGLPDVADNGAFKTYLKALGSGNQAKGMAVAAPMLTQFAQQAEGEKSAQRVATITNTLIKEQGNLPGYIPENLNQAELNRALLNYANFTNLGAQTQKTLAEAERASIPAKPIPQDVIFNSQAELEKVRPSAQWDYEVIQLPDGKVAVVGGKFNPRAPVASDLGPEYMPDPNVPGGVIPRPGSKTDLEQKEKARKFQTQLEASKAASANIDDVISKTLPMVGNWTTGLMGEQFSHISGTPAADLRAMLATIEANIGFDALMEMRKNSPTGGALGNISEKELAALQQSIRSVKQSQSPDQLRDNLLAIQKHYSRVIKAESGINPDVRTYNPQTGKLE